MSPRPRRPQPVPPSPFPEVGLAELGLHKGDVVRFRRRDGERWKEATVAQREKDGSVGLHDGKGAARSIAIDAIEVRDRGPRGGVVWEPLTARAARTEQIALVDASAKPSRPRPPAAPAPAEASPDEGEPEPEPEQLRLL